MLEHALRYAALGLRVFPVAARKKEPPCLKAWQQHATTDRAKIGEWWRRWPDANLGACMGRWPRPGLDLIALDIDQKNGIDGFETLRDLELEHGDLSDTWRSRSPGGSEHIYFLHPGGEIKTRAKVWPGIDVRADHNGYVLLPPSIRSDGKYLWLIGFEPWDLKVAPAPEWLRQALVEPQGQPGKEWVRTAPSEWARLISEPILEGERNTVFVRLLGHFLGHGLGGRETLELLRLINAARAKPPVPDEHLVERVEWACRVRLRRRA